ncbi:hypothetical protein EDB86DRAFT_3003486 [Lactarius hatsudake]|nr:hypothetical protein EDB86DRAFT_3003486 [Lactarius hatsudake]
MASEAALKPMQVLAWCVFCSESFSLFAWLLICLTPRNPHAVVFILESSFILPFNMWDGVRVQFMDRLDEIKDEMQELRAMGT